MATIKQRLEEAERTLLAIACYGALVNDEPESRACTRNWIDKYASKSIRAEIQEILSRRE
jgi:hypothetical protein